MGIAYAGLPLERITLHHERGHWGLFLGLGDMYLVGHASEGLLAVG